MHTCLIKNRFRAYWLMGVGSSKRWSGLKSCSMKQFKSCHQYTPSLFAFQVWYFCLLYSQMVQMWQHCDFWLPLSWRHLYSQRKSKHFSWEFTRYPYCLFPKPGDQGKDAQLDQGHMPIPGLQAEGHPFPDTGTTWNFSGMKEGLVPRRCWENKYMFGCIIYK